MGTYDLTMKRLTSKFSEDYVRFALKVEQFAVEHLDVKEADKELPSLAREVDFVAKVKVGEEQAILLIEFQTAWVAEMPERMAGYSWRLFERYHLGVYPVVVVLRSGGRLQNEWRMQVLGREMAWWRFEVIPVWEAESQEVVAQKLAGIYPLLPLMQWEGKSAEEILEESQRLILEEIEDREERADAYVALRVLSGIKYPLEFVHQILRRKEIMLESPVYQEILEEGRVAGLKEGQEEGLRESVLEVLEVRFGVVPLDVREQVRQIRGKETLQGLLRRVAVVESIEAFRDELSKIQIS